MEHARLAKRSMHESRIGHSPSLAKQDQEDEARSAAKKAVRKKAAPRVNPARPLRKMGSKSKSNKLVCRYCGSDDLAPSFVKRRSRSSFDNDVR